MSAVEVMQSDGSQLKNRRVGLLLAAVALLYITAVIAFIIIF